MASIGLIDYGVGNFSSVLNALQHLGLNVVELREPEQFPDTTHLILPGVGAFATAMRKLERLHLIEALEEDVIHKGKPFLGICLGMQILADTGSEFESYPGLAYISGTSDEIEARALSLPVPHMGWNQLEFHRQSLLFAEMELAPSFYVVHSYQLYPRDRLY